MYKITITVEKKSERNTILSVLTDAEENGSIIFPFNTESTEITPPKKGKGLAKNSSYWGEEYN